MMKHSLSNRSMYRNFKKKSFESIYDNFHSVDLSEVGIGSVCEIKFKEEKI